MTKKVSVQRFGDELSEIFSVQKMVVFLCGPTLDNLNIEGATLRGKLQNAMEKEGFEVVLGEDAGLENLRSKYGHYAHENELQFIQSQCNAIVLIASSPGALCELGLFSYKKTHEKTSRTDFILILHERYKGQLSYINEGPVKAIDDFGKVYHGDLENFDIKPILHRLIRRRALYFTDMRGRPPNQANQP